MQRPGPKATWGGQCLFHLNNSQVTLCNLGKSQQELQVWELKQKSCRNAAYWFIPPGLLFAFLYTSGPHVQGLHHPQWAGPFHINHQPRKCPTDFVYRAIWWGVFSQLSFPSEMTPAHVRLTKNNQDNCLFNHTAYYMQNIAKYINSRMDE